MTVDLNTLDFLVCVIVKRTDTNVISLILLWQG